MKIECILKRQGGTRAEIGGIEYHFEPLDDGAHVAEVEKEAHIDRFLAIPEGYKVYHGKLTPTGKPQEVSAAPAAVMMEKAHQNAFLNGSSQHQAQYEIGGQTYALGDIVRLAFEASSLSNDEWNALDEDDIAAKLDIVLDDLADKAEQEGKATPDEERAALVEAYKAKFGKAPHYRLSLEKIKEALE